ncbi:hypothetical protein GF371_03675 [Candidatus Woesearchaeota archaeon]|nr:hypothetical protein [Candidatus Woesearchaeota archaeon]
MALKDYTLDYSKEEYKKTIVRLLKLEEKTLMQIAEKFDVIFVERPEKLRPIDYADSLMADVPKSALLEELERVEKS